MFERFNEDARRVLFFARYEASQLGSFSIETEHLLLGLIREPPGVMTLVFARTQLALELIRQEVEKRTKPRREVAPNVEIPFSAETKRILQHAVTEADRLGHNKIGAEHLLLGILNEEGCVAASVLKAQGIRLDTCREGIVQARNEGERARSTTTTKGRMTSFAPQLLVDNLDRSIVYYRKIGFSFDEPRDGFYAIGRLDGLEVHVKEAPKNRGERQWRRDNEHLDAAAGVDGIEAFYELCVANGVTIIKPLAATAWGTKDFYLEDPDGHIISFGGRPAAG